MDATAMEGSRVVGCGHSFTSEREPAQTKQSSVTALYRTSLQEYDTFDQLWTPRQ
jgi:hypothetical protein